MKPTKKKKTRRFSITRSELGRLAFCNSVRYPKMVNDNGVRKEWVGIGGVNVGTGERKRN